MYADHNERVTVAMQIYDFLYRRFSIHFLLSIQSIRYHIFP